MKNVGDAGFSRKRGGNAGSGPPPPPAPFQTLREGLEGLTKVTSVDFRQFPDPKQHT